MERFIGIIKSALRKLLSAYPGSFWDEHLYSIAGSLRMMATKSHGYSSFEIVFKQIPEFPAVVAGPCN